MLKYETVNTSAVESACKAFKRHLWYLTSEMIPLALFSEKVSSEERHVLSQSLLGMQPEEDDFGKLKLPEDITESTALSDLVSEASWYTVTDHDFLLQPVEEWVNLCAYQSSLINITELNVINDCAERGVK